MEIFDLYDENRIKTDKTMVRGEKVPKGYYRVVVHVCIINSEGKMLIQKRQPFKHGWSGMWDLSVGGSVVSGETPAMGAQRELSEELGIDMSFEGIRPKLTVNFSSGFDDIFVIRRDTDISSLHLQAEEVEQVRWAERDEIFSMIDSGEFIPYHKSLIRMLFYFRDRNGVHTAADPTR